MTFSPCFLCHSPAVAPLLLSICPPFHALKKIPSHFPRSVELPVHPSCFINHGIKKGHPEKLLKLSEVSPFCHRVDGNGFLERMFFITDIIARFFHGSNPFGCSVLSVLSLCSRMPIFPAKFRPCAFQMLSGYFHTIQQRKTLHGAKIALLDELGNILPNIKKRINFIVPLI